MGNFLSGTKKTNTCIDYDQIVSLPDDLIVEILCKLPVKSLIRFKTVCKQWKGLIISHVFIYKYIQLGDRNNDPILDELSMELQCYAGENLGFVDKQIASYFILNYRTEQLNDGFSEYVMKLRNSSNRVRIVALLNMVNRDIMKGVRRFEAGVAARVVAIRALKGAVEELGEGVAKRKRALNGALKELDKEVEDDLVRHAMSRALKGAVGGVVDAAAEGVVDPVAEDVADRIMEMGTDKIMKCIVLPLLIVGIGATVMNVVISY